MAQRKSQLNCIFVSFIFLKTYNHDNDKEDNQRNTKKKDGEDLIKEATIMDMSYTLGIIFRFSHPQRRDMCKAPNGHNMLQF